MAKRGRIPRPWYRKQTRSWYVMLDGEQVPLGKSKREAHAEFHRLMTRRGDGSPGRGRLTVNELADAWLAECERTLAAGTVGTYRQHVDAFRRECGGMEVRDLHPYHVREWAVRDNPAQATEHLRISVIRRMTSWAEEQRYIDADPIRRLKRPAMTRRKPITVEQAQAIMSVVPPPIQLALRLILLLGVRPGELCSLTAARIDPDTRRARVRGKRGERVVPVPEAAWGLLAPLLRDHPAGPLLHSARKPMSPSLISSAVVYAREKLGESYHHVSPHCFRGLFSTIALRRGVDSLTVSKLLGHRDPTILAKHYEGLDDSDLREAMERATRTDESSGDTPPGPPPRTG